MLLYMYIAQGQGQTTPWGQILMSIESPYHFAHLLQVLKWSLQNLILYTFLMILYIYIAPGQGHTTPWGQTFDVNRKPLSLCLIVARLKKNLILNTFFMILYMYIAPGKGRQHLGDKLLMSTESPYHFAHLLQVYKKCFKVRFYIHSFRVSPYV